MNSWPTLQAWSQFGGVLALELFVLFAVTKLVSLRLRSPVWRRSVGQICLMAMLLVLVGELNGVRGLMRWPEQPLAQAPASQNHAVVVTIQDPVAPTESTPWIAREARPEASVSRWRQPTNWPAIFWCGLTALLLGRILLAQVLTLCFRRASRRYPEAALHQRVQVIAQLLGLRRRVGLVLSGKTGVPFTFGVWWPVIVVPKDFAATFTSEQQDVALAHELAHIAGNDNAWRTFSNVVSAILWWHPGVWLAQRELAHASELVADESSLLLADGPHRLAECLVTCAKQVRRPAVVAWLGMDGGGFRSALGQRVARLLELKPQPQKIVRVPWYLRLLVPILCALLLWGGMAAALKSDAPRGNAWRTSILGSAFAAAEQLSTRFFQIDPNTFQQAISNVIQYDAKSGGTRPLADPRAGTNEIIRTLQAIFKTAGVDLTAEGKAIFFNDRRGALMVRATPQDLDAVEKAVQLLNMSPPQLTIRVKALEVPVTAMQNAASWYLGHSLSTNSTASSGASTNLTASIPGILTDDQFRQIVREMEKTGGSDLLSAPEVTTLSGRQAQIKVVDIRYIVTDLDINTNAAPPKSSQTRGNPGVTVSGSGESIIMPIAQPFELGPVIDVIPHVQADGYTIQMTVLPSLREFLGYDDPKLVQPAAAGAAQYNGLTSPMPLPKFRLRQTSTTARIFDGQTIMIGAGTARNMEKDRDTDGVISTNYTDKALFFFVSPRLVDPAGNPLHSNEELRKLHQQGSPDTKGIAPSDLRKSGLRKTAEPQRP